MTAWRLMIHGGCGAMRPGTARPRAGSARARRARARRSTPARRSSAGGGSALDAVEAAARVLEEDPCFNAGRGSVLDRDGQIELDAAIMDGRDRRAGAVAGLRTTRAPISLARRLMEQGPHVFLTGDGRRPVRARARASSRSTIAGSRPPSGGASSTRCWPAAASSTSDIKYGTIGAVAVDADGHVAAATSTGGLTAKRWGRIGDSPLIGAGTYADDRAAAVSRDRLGRIFHPRGRRARSCARGCGSAASRCSRRSTGCWPTSRRWAATAG